MSIRANKNFNENKLIKILNLLDSPMEGEVLAAAKSASRYLKSHGSSWNKVIRKSQTPHSEPPQQAEKFIALRDAVILRRTQRARLLSVKLTNGAIENLWFPCSTLREIGKRIYAAQWIVERKEKELMEEGKSSHIRVGFT